jgi:hypothetical protein
MKRRRKTLSGTQAQHTERQAVHLQRASVATAMAHRDLHRSEDCGEAAVSLLHAASSWGAYNAEKDWSERVSSGENRVSNAYAEVREQFFERCVRGRNR